MSNKAFIIKDKSFGETVKSFRTAKKLTQKQVANLMGMDTSYYSKLEAGKLSNSRSPSNRTIEKFCYELKSGRFIDSGLCLADTEEEVIGIISRAVSAEIEQLKK